MTGRDETATGHVKQFEAVIVGASLGGLISAALLTRRGYRVAVIDKLEQAGGRCGSVEYNGYHIAFGHRDGHGVGDNVFGLPLILGAACEYGMNIVLRFMEGRDHGGPLIARSTVMGVLVAGLTTIVGFGSLLMADHRGIFGLGLLLTLGTVASLVASLVVLPVLLRMVQQMRDARLARHEAEAASVVPSAPAPPEHVGPRET